MLVNKFFHLSHFQHGWMAALRCSGIIPTSMRSRRQVFKFGHSFTPPVSFFETAKRWQSTSTEQVSGNKTAVSRPFLLRNRRPMLVDVKLTPSAQKKLLMLAEKYKSDFYLRLRVVSGGCSGFQYRFSQETVRQEDDTVISAAGEGFTGVAGVLIDSMSAQFLKETVVDYVEDFVSASFQVAVNAAARDSCSCGSSFEIDDPS